jgi:hypothetical protein
MSVCTKCQKDKDDSEYFFDKRRGKVRMPCRDCSNLQKRLRRKERFLNNTLVRSEIDHQYRLKDFPEDFRLFAVENLFLYREIFKKAEPIVAMFSSEGMLLYCKNCGIAEKVQYPIPVDRLAKLSKNFNELHVLCKQKI